MKFIEKLCIMTAVFFTIVLFTSPAYSATKCKIDVDMDAKAGKATVTIDANGTGEIKFKGGTPPFTISGNATELERISSDGKSKKILFKSKDSKVIYIRGSEKKPVKKVKVTIEEVNNKDNCKKKDIPKAKGFKIVVEGTIINSIEYKTDMKGAFTSTVDGNVFFINAESIDAIDKGFSVFDKKGKKLVYSRTPQEKFRVIPDKVSMTKRDTVVLVIKGGNPPYKVESDRLWIIDAPKGSFNNKRFLMPEPSNNGEVKLTFTDTGKKNDPATVTVNVRDDRHEPDYRSDRFRFNLGVVMLNPYSINKPVGSNVFELETQQTTSNFFEFQFVDRGAFLDRPEKKKDRFDFDGKIGVGMGSDDEKESSTITGDSYGELSAGWMLYARNICEDKFLIFTDPYKINNETKTCASQKDELTFSTNVELIYGFSTDSKFLMIHDYYGGGLTLSYGIPMHNEKKRRVEALFGFYFGKVAVPDMDDIEKSANGDGWRPDFNEQNTSIIRADFRLPVGKTQMLSIIGRYFKTDNSKSIEPWIIGAAVSISADKLVDGILSVFD